VLGHLLRTAELSAGDLALLLGFTEKSRDQPLGFRKILEHETVVLYFNKPSTRTRLSFETAVVRLGGTPLVVGPAELQLGRGETIEDTARVMSRYARAVTVRTYSDEDVERFAAAATVPVVNALTDKHHPCQSIADLATLREKKGRLRSLRVAYVGDGNNVAHSLMEAAAIAGMHLTIATPARYAPDAGILAAAVARGGEIRLTTDPFDAVDGVDAVYTDAWYSMGDPAEERTVRREAFQPYQVNRALMDAAKPDAIFMHCLPDHRGDEVTAEIVDGPASVVFDQAEYRLHAAVAILWALLAERLEGCEDLTGGPACSS